MYAITGLAAGAYTVEVDGCAAGNFAADTITGVQVTAGQTTTENATLVPPGAVTGKVRDSSGNPLSGACVTVKDSSRPDRHDPHRRERRFNLTASRRAPTRSRSAAVRPATT